MYCNKCGNELDENSMYCNKCGNKLDGNGENNDKLSNSSYSEEYKSKLNLANNSAEMFYNSEKHTSVEYNKVAALYGEVEKIGSHILDTHINQLDFFIKGNLLEDTYFFNISQFEKTLDNLLQKAMLNAKTDKEKEEIKNKYNKQVIIEQYKEKVEKLKKQNSKKSTKLFFKYLIIFIMIFAIIIVVNNILFNQPKDNNSDNTSTTTSISIIEKYGISEEVQDAIRTNWNKISGYGTSNIEKVILDVTRGRLYITYTDTEHNGLYVYSDTSSGMHYGNDIWASTKTYREYYEQAFSIWLNTFSDEYKKLTKTEFIRLLNEL